MVNVIAGLGAWGTLNDDGLDVTVEPLGAFALAVAVLARVPLSTSA